MLKIQCKTCRAIIDVPLPDPVTVEKIVKEPCKCGLTEEAREHSSWAKAIGFAAIVGLIAAFGGCHTVYKAEIEKIKAETEQRKAQNASNDKEMERMAVDLKKYKDLFEELKRSVSHPQEK